MEFVLKRCPCCDGRPVLIVEREGFDAVVRVECTECMIATPSVVYQPRSRAEQQRNRLVTGWLPDLTAARQHVSEIWNKRPGDALH